MGAARRLRDALAGRGIANPSDEMIIALNDIGNIGDEASDAIFTFTEGASARQLIADLEKIRVQLFALQNRIEEEWVR